MKKEIRIRMKRKPTWSVRADEMFESMFGVKLALKEIAQWDAILLRRSCFIYTPSKDL